MAFDRLQGELEARRNHALYRSRRLLQSPQGAEILLDGKPCLSFCSNDYLGLANDPRLKNAMTQAINEAGVGGGASHLVNGHHQYHHDLELALAEFLQVERVLCFSTGYMANLGAINGLLQKQDQVFEDRLNHASLLDAGLLSGARFQRYLHNDVENLRRKMEKVFTPDTDRLVVTDGVFSMDGDIAPLPELLALCRKKDAWLMVDDAHGLGVIGEQGRGTVSAAGLASSDIDILMGTLGKALGSFGAFVAGSEMLIETLIQQAHPYIYTTAMPPAVAAATRESLRIVENEEWRRTHLSELISLFREGCKQLGLDLMSSTTPIQPILIGDASDSLKWSQRLEAQGVIVTAIRPPTVAAGSSRLRVTLSAAHTHEHVHRLLAALKQCQDSLPSSEGVS